MNPISSERAVYRRSDLVRLLEPKSICIVGASSREGAFGALTQANLAGYDGEILLVNSRYESIGDQRCYPSIRALPRVPDCVILAVGRDAVEGYVLECEELGVGGVIVYASGYAETSLPGRAELQQRLSAIAARSGVRILGPNCMGLANYAAETILSFVAYTPGGVPRPVSIGVASQSGALSNSLGQAAEQGVSFSHVLSTGNACDVDVADLVAYLAEAPHCRVIACVFEGLAQPRRLLEAAQIAWEAGRPLVVCKIATGQSGAEAAASHTGAMAGSNEAYRAAFESVGAIIVDRYEDILEVAGFFAKAPAPLAQGVAVISTSGGAAIMSADAAEARGVAMPQPRAEATRVLESRIPDFGSARNPCDVTAQVMADPESLEACAHALLADPAFGVLVMAQPQAYEFAVPRIASVGRLARAEGKMACNVLVSQWLSGPGARETDMNDSVALFRSIDRCFATIKMWQSHHAMRVSGLAPSSSRDESLQASKDHACALRLLENSAENVLTERTAKALLATYGIPVVQEHLVQDAAQAARVAASMGWPVVLKAESPDLPHKTEAGVVQLNLRDEAQVREAHALIEKRARAVGPHVRLQGILVQQMVEQGLEIMVGARRDPLFGPLIVVGLGGVMVELLSDTVVALAPVTHSNALAMLQRLKGAALLRGFRGSEPVDVDALADAIVRVSLLAADFPNDIVEIDVNPLICTGGRIVAVDALVIREAFDRRTAVPPQSVLVLSA
ncbi:acetate--CoA ligase family protein [Hydrogenophaga sp. BPS33]|uniref:acetate--CoA ligase family protein n=1 Tax=Hydrogenophaga sp. BPS33 TaxID=2651974 RepID=UPI0013202952|nr:acetate--CoA ligase family protein [Hydrogenophaga sp. BPS33]QHE84781.1 acetate--CoA ligase family protein [Hydrogenophaga sp. BPS33]